MIKIGLSSFPTVEWHCFCLGKEAINESRFSLRIHVVAAVHASVLEKKS
jgi:hypothetical protein